MRINALGNTATDFASDDYIAIDGSTNGSRKMTKDTLLEKTEKNTLSFIDPRYNLDIEQGALAAATGAETISSSRVRSVGFKNCFCLEEIYAPTGWIVEAFAYDKNDVSGYLGKLTLLNATDAKRTRGNSAIFSSYPTTKFVRLVVSKSDNSNITPSDVTTAGVYFTFCRSINEINSIVESEKSKLETTENVVTLLDSKYYFDYEQGALAAATGDVVTSSTKVRSVGFQDLSRLEEVYAPTGWIVEAFAYTTNDVSGYLGKMTFLNATANPRHKDKSTILTNYPTTKFIRIVITKSDNSNITPSDVTTAGIYGCFVRSINDLYNIVLPDQYLYDKGLTLTTNRAYILKAGSERKKNLIISIDSKFTQGVGITDVPYITLVRASEGYDGVMRNYYDQRYYIGRNGSYCKQMLRVPPYGVTSGDLKLTIVVPAGVTLSVREISVDYDDAINMNVGGVKLCAHSLCGDGAPANTMAAFETAARLGYPYCITIPKVTSDGVFVCLHDDNSIQATARNDDGSQIAPEYQNRPVSDFTYSELLQFDFGIIRGKNWAGERIPLLEDFFKLCAKTGMRPMLSVHPDLSGYWGSIKSMAEKYDVLHRLNVKSDYISLAVPMAVLLDEIESYTIDDSTGTDRSSEFATLKTTYGITKARCVLEYEYSCITDALISSALSNGYECGVFNYNADVNTKELVDKGVTIFTERFNCSAGLSW